MLARHTIHRILFGVVTALGGGAGILLSILGSRYFVGLTPLTLYATYAAFVVLGLVGGVLVATPISNAVTQLLESSLVKLQQMAPGEVVLGALGLIAGLGVAFFVSLALQSFSFGSVPWLGPVLILCSAMLFSSLGAFLGIRLSALPAARQLFRVEESSAHEYRVLVDTSIIVDGRLANLLATGFLPGSLVVPQFVLGELQMLADSEDPLRRVRGRRGLESLEALRNDYPFEVLDEPEGKGADQKLIRMARTLRAAILTNDYNLQKVAVVQSIKVLNLNQLAAALKPSVLPGQMLQLQLQREGKESHQAVAHFEDGTMVVVERGRPHIGKEVIGEVTSVMQTATGKMVFAKFRQLVETQEATAVDAP